MAKAKNPKIEPEAPEGVATTEGDDGSTFYAWRKDGRKPNVPEDWHVNIHGALSPHGDADFADRHGPA